MNIVSYDDLTPVEYTVPVLAPAGREALDELALMVYRRNEWRERRKHLRSERSEPGVDT